ncbi:MAG: hypothetical protein QM770_05850 [Tepidisphaeraceae bacterium]
MRVALALLTLILALLCTNARAEHTVVTLASPTTGPWKGFAPGDFVVFKSTAWDTGATFRREMLLGLNGEGKAVIGFSRGNSADGPWAQATTQLRATDDPATPANSLGRKSFTVDEKTYDCEGVQWFEVKPEGQTTTERWTDTATGLRVQSTRKVMKPEGVELVEERLERVTPFEIGETTVDMAVYLSTTTRNGAIAMSRRTAFSESVPGRRVAYARWVGEVPGTRYAVDETVVAMGKNVEAMEKLTGLESTTKPATP